MKEPSDAKAIKALLIDYFIKMGLVNDYLFGSEIFCGIKKRQIDLVAVGLTSIAYEIKSGLDDFRRLREQLDDYRKVFDYQYLVTTAYQEERANQILKKDEGLIVINDDKSISIRRIAKKLHSYDKSEILATIPLAFLKKHAKVEKKSNLNCREQFMEYEIEELQRLLLFYFKEKLKLRNEYFFNEKGLITHFEDVKYLSTTVAEEIYY